MSKRKLEVNHHILPSELQVPSIESEIERMATILLAAGQTSLGLVSGEIASRLGFSANNSHNEVMRLARVMKNAGATPEAAAETIGLQLQNMAKTIVKLVYDADRKHNLSQIWIKERFN